MNIEKLKEVLHKKLDEAIEVAIKCGKERFFEVRIKNINGDVVTKIEFSDKEKVG
ncbi:MAG: hypothetical protein H0Z28_12730 [Archaeoglobus sp.]|nr:hypothetical protein [Archaeoglobus sp.]